MNLSVKPTDQENSLSMQSASQQLSVLEQNADHIYSLSELEAKLKKGKPLRIKLGLDPSSPDLHLGHVVVLDKIAEFQKFGHTAIIIIGDYTARIGDPTGRSKARLPLEPEQIEQNAATYQAQVFRVLDPARTELVYNSQWFSRLQYADILRLNSHITVSQLLEREDFKKRYTEGKPITLTEFQYPLMQGYDSVMIQSDVELGGNDQLFNNLVGRDLQRERGLEPQVVMVMPLLVGTDGVQKMSKSLGNGIGITDQPVEMFGKTMSISDQTMETWRKLIATHYALNHPVPAHPMEAKKELAQAIVARFHGMEAGQHARSDFEAKFSKKDLQEADLPNVAINENPIWIIKLLQDIGAAPSSSEARRAIGQGAVKLNGQRLSDPQAQLTIQTGDVLQYGKKFFARLLLKN